VDLVGKKMADTVQVMSVTAFAEYLQRRFDEDVVDVMKSKISGSVFLKLSERQIECMIPAMGDVVELVAL